jgi:diguanylate cyclase (GGDEF)-like protein
MTDGAPCSEPAHDPPASQTGAQKRVWQLTATMAAVAAALAGPGFVAAPHLAVPTVAWCVLLLLFALAEACAIHLPTQGSAHTLVLREIPAIAALTFLTPHQYVTAYVLGTGLALLVWARVRGLKLAFNVAMLSLEAALGSLTYHAIFGGGDPIGLNACLAAGAAVLVTDLVSAGAVTAAICLTESRFDVAVLRAALRAGVSAALINTCVGLLLVTIVIARPLALPLLGGIVVLIALGYRVHISLARGYARLELLYRFVGSTGHLSQLDAVMSSILSEAAQLLHATRAQLVVLPTGGPGDGRYAHCVTWHDGQVSSEELDLRAASSQAWWRRCLEGETVLLRHESSTRRRTDAQEGNPRDGIAVPLRPAATIEAVLLVTDRTFETETFGEEDLKVFETLTAHATVALDKARLVDSLRQLADERAHDALHDPLTGLLNRRAFDQAVEAVMNGDATAAVLLLDLDDFKDVNDTLGHSVGDQLLIVTGRRLGEASGHVVARLGGDEFAVLLPGMDVTAAVKHARELHKVLSEPVPLRGVELTTSASIGVTAFHGASRSSEEVMGEADVAMYAAKSSQSGVQAYRVEDSESTARRLTLAADLKAALREHQIDVWYQPQASARSGRVTGFEALLRWNHPRFGWVPPMEVIAVAHRIGLAGDLTTSVLRHALRARATWVREGHDLNVAVNVTPTDLAEGALLERVDAELATTGTPPGALVLEITESDAMRDPDQCLDVMSSLAARGVQLSADDFGTGHSSLAYLDRLPVHELKIDQSFISRLAKDSSDSTIVRATITLAHDLGLRVVAEGVESDRAWSLIADMGCDRYQGYRLARPMPGGEVLTWLTRHDARTPGHVRHGGCRSADPDSTTSPDGLVADVPGAST